MAVGGLYKKKLTCGGRGWKVVGHLNLMEIVADGNGFMNVGEMEWFMMLVVGFL